MPDPITQLSDWLRQYDGAQIVWTLVGICALIALLWKWAKRAIPSIKKGIAFLDALGSLPVFMDDTRSFITEAVADRVEQKELLLEVRHEVLPNSGGSLRDDVETLALQLNKIEAHQDKDYAAIGELRAEIAQRRERREEALASKGFPHDTSESSDV